MYEESYYQLMAKYNRWMNRKLYAVCADIPDQTRREDRGAFFKSIHGTLNHLLFGDLVWMDRFTGAPRRNIAMGEELYASFEALRDARDSKDAEIVAWANELREAWLREPFTYTSGIDAKTRKLPAWVLVTHMFNHQTHHRGQLTTLIKQLGYEPGITDLPWLPDLELPG